MGRTSLRVTPLSKSVPSGPSRSVNLTRRPSRSTLLRLSVRRSPRNFAAHPAANWRPAQRSASPRLRLLFLRYQRRLATWSPKRSASTSPSWCPCSSPLRSALTSPRRSAPGPAQTQGRSRSLSSRSGVMSPLPSLVLPNLALFAIQLLLLMEHSLLLNPALLKYLQLFCYLDALKIWIFQFYKYQITFVVLSYPKSC